MVPRCLGLEPCRWWSYRRHFCTSKDVGVFLAEESLVSQNMINSSTGAHSNLKEHICNAFAAEETDGILSLSNSLFCRNINNSPICEIEPLQLLEESLEAVKGNRGQAAAIFNAWIASCYLLQINENPESTETFALAASSYAVQLLKAYDELSEKYSISPDTITLCLAYSAIMRTTDHGTRKMATALLDRVAQLSKKQAGSKRRKQLAAARRRATYQTFSEVEKDLQALLGSKDFSILYEDGDMVVINKPSGISCFHAKKTTAGKVRKKSNKIGDNEDEDYDFSASNDISLHDAFVHFNLPLSTLNPDALGLVHRLDRGTSGCMVWAKRNEIHAQLVALFFVRRVYKEYTVLTAPAPQIERLRSNVPVVMSSSVDGRPAKSVYTLVEQFGQNSTASNTSQPTNTFGTAALGRVQTLTGRKHQVRVHCATDLKSPVLGDPLYGRHGNQALIGETIAGLLSSQYFFLHASSLSIPLMKINVTAPIPSWWMPTLGKLRSLR